MTLDRRHTVDPERGDGGVVGEDGREGIDVVLLTRSSLLPLDLGDLFGRPSPRC